MLCYFLTTSVVFSQILFARAFGGTDYDWVQSIIQTSDGGYALAGWTQSFGAGSIDFLVLKLSGSGGLQWAKTFQGTNDDRAYAIIQTTDGGYAIAGETYSWGAGNSDVFVVKLNSSGGLQWSRTFGGTNAESGYSIIQTTDGGYAVAGMTYGYGSGANDFLILKLGTDGSLSWAKTFGGTRYDQAHSIIQTSDGGYAVAGYYDYSASNRDFLILKLNSDGSLSWAKTFGGASGEEAYSIIQTTDGGYAVVGETWTFGAGNNDLLVLKLNSDGSLSWAETFGGTNLDYGKSIVWTTDGGYAVAGHTYTFGAGNGDFFVLKLNSSGGLQWARAFGGASTEQAFSLIRTSDGGYAVAGGTYTFGAGSSDFLVLKLGFDGNYPGCVVSCSPSVSSPNPTTSSLTVGADCNLTPALSQPPVSTTPSVSETNVCGSVYEDVEEGVVKGSEFKAAGEGIYLFMPTEAKLSLTLYDAQGRLVERLYDGILSSGGHTFSPKLEAKGVYMAVLRYQGGIKSLKIVR